MKIVLFISFFMCFLLGNSQTTTLSPSTITTNTSVGTITWNNVSNVSANGGGVSETGNMAKNEISYYIVATNFGFSIPLGATITGIEVNIRKSAQPVGDGGMKDQNINIVKGGVIGSTNRKDNGAWGTVLAYTTYGTSADMWGETWTPAEVNANDFGIALAVKKTGNGTKIAEIDHITITVHYLVALPVELIRFDAELEDSYTLLNWATASEVNSSYFVVERSFDGIIFESIDFIEGAGQSSIVIEYFAYDFRAYLGGVVYYRLKQVDIDGTTEYSNIISLTKALSSVRVYYDGSKIQIESDDTITDICVYRLDGTEVNINSQLLTGLYIVTLNRVGTLKTFKLLIK